MSETPEGVALIGPVVYYGHPEMDLASIDFSSPVPDAFFHGYASLRRIDAGLPMRRRLLRIPAWPEMGEVDGPPHLRALRDALEADR